MRQADDGFAAALWQASRRAFSRALREALEAWDASNAEKVRACRWCCTARGGGARHVLTLTHAAQCVGGPGRGLGRLQR